MLDSLFNEVADPQRAPLSKKRLQYRCFLAHFAKFLRKPSYRISSDNCFSIIAHSHCLKSVQIRRFLWSVFSCIRTECGDLLLFTQRSVYSPITNFLVVKNDFILIFQLSTFSAYLLYESKSDVNISAPNISSKN